MNSLKWAVVLCLAVFGLLACGPTQAQHAGHSETTDTPERITIDKILTKMQSGEQIVFLDSRNDHAWSQATSKIPGALRVSNNGHLRQLINELPKDQFVVTYCT